MVYLVKHAATRTETAATCTTTPNHRGITNECIFYNDYIAIPLPSFYTPRNIYNQQDILSDFMILLSLLMYYTNKQGSPSVMWGNDVTTVSNSFWKYNCLPETSRILIVTTTDTSVYDTNKIAVKSRTMWTGSAGGESLSMPMRYATTDGQEHCCAIALAVSNIRKQKAINKLAILEKLRNKILYLEHSGHDTKTKDVLFHVFQDFPRELVQYIMEYYKEAKLGEIQWNTSDPVVEDLYQSMKYDSETKDTIYVFLTEDIQLQQEKYLFL